MVVRNHVLGLDGIKISEFKPLYIYSRVTTVKSRARQGWFDIEELLHAYEMVCWFDHQTTTPSTRWFEEYILTKRCHNETKREVRNTIKIYHDYTTPNPPENLPWQAPTTCTPLLSSRKKVPSEVRRYTFFLLFCSSSLPIENSETASHTYTRSLAAPCMPFFPPQNAYQCFFAPSFHRQTTDYAKPKYSLPCVMAV